MESLRGIVNFARVARLGSFAKAARELGISAEAVSQNISRLEKGLGVRLLARTTRQLGLTAEGQAFLERCQEPLAELERACRQAREDTQTPRGRLRVTAVSPVAYQYLIPALPLFFERYPQIELELELSEDANPLIGRRFDVGIRVGALEDAAFVARPLGPMRLLTVASPAYLATAGTPSTPEALDQHRLLVAHFVGHQQPAPFLLQSRTGPEAPAVTRVLPTTGSMAGRFVCSDYRGLLAACERGLGIAQLPQPVALEALRAGRLKLLLAGYTLNGLQLFLHYPSRQQLPARVRAWVDFVIEQFGGHPDLTVDPDQWAA
jgi:DNA-binding transcriptional LysR family regulator